MDPTLFTADLERKPQTLRALAAALDDGSARWPLPTHVSRVLLIGMGSSLFAATESGVALQSRSIS